MKYLTLVTLLALVACNSHAQDKATVHTGAKLNGASGLSLVVQFEKPTSIDLKAPCKAVLKYYFEDDEGWVRVMDLKAPIITMDSNSATFFIFDQGDQDTRRLPNAKIIKIEDIHWVTDPAQCAN